MLSFLFFVYSTFAFDNEQIQQAFYSTVLIQLPNKSHCTGVLVSENHVLTAAHCVDAKGYFKDATVHLHILDQLKSHKEFVTDSVQQIKLHPQFNSKKYETDLVMLKLKKSIPEKLNQARIQFDLKSPSSENYNSQALLMGYGISAKAKVDVQQYEKELKYPKIRGKQFNLNTKIDQNERFILDNRKAQACVDDSGGPLFKCAPL